MCLTSAPPAAGRTKASASASASGWFSRCAVTLAAHSRSPPTRDAHVFSFPPPGGAPDELLSSSSIFEHVDRLSRGSSDGARRPANKVQLIAMQPRPSPSHPGPAQPSPSHPSPTHPSPTLSERVNTEVRDVQALKNLVWLRIARIEGSVNILSTCCMCVSVTLQVKKIYEKKNSKC